MTQLMVSREASWRRGKLSLGEGSGVLYVVLSGGQSEERAESLVSLES